MKALRRSNTSSPSSSPSLSWIQFKSLLVLTSSPDPDRGSIKSPWSQRKKKHALSSRQWHSLFLADGKLRDGGVKLLKSARRGGIDPDIRAAVWPFLLGVYDLNSTDEERSSIQQKRRVEYQNLRRRCWRLNQDKIVRVKGIGEISQMEVLSPCEDPESRFAEDFSTRSFSTMEGTASEDQFVFQATEGRTYIMEGINDIEDRAVYDKTPSCNDGEDPESRFSEDFNTRSFSTMEGTASEDQFVYQAPEGKTYILEEINDIEDRAVYGKTSSCNTGKVEGAHHLDQSVYGKTPSCNAGELEGARHLDQAVYDRTSLPNEHDRTSLPNEHDRTSLPNELVMEHDSETIPVDSLAVKTDSSDSESSIEDDEATPISSITDGILGPDPEYGDSSSRTSEDYTTWWRIIRLDALRTNAEWVIYSPNQATVSEDKANQSAAAVGLKDYEHLEPCMIYHASRLVALLEAYALYDPEIGYCQGMSDLLSPILAVIEDDHEAFWCFVGFMKKARHNFRLDEVGIQRQLGIVSKIIKSKDLLLYRHLENLKAENCFFLYRMVVVLFRRELSFEQTVCLWEVMWADQAAIRAGISKSSWGRIRLRAPPTDDLLLYAIAACVLQRRKLIIQKYSSMEEIIRECNDMAGQLDVWRLLDDAHDLVVTLHDRI